MDPLATKFFEDGEQVSATVTVQARAADIYNAWAHLQGLPRFIDAVKSVTLGARNSLELHAGDADEEFDAMWGAEILADEPGKRFSWRGLLGGCGPRLLGPRIPAAHA